jgi:ABC-2 type transport system ATP-binding protein
MRRRAALAATLADGPDVLLLDEPMEGLDPNQRHDVRQAILRLRHDATILMTTHIMQDIPGLCGQMVLLEHGVVEFRGSPQKFAESKAIEPDARELEDAFRRRTIRGEK